MKDTKSNILKAALKLFNQNGYVNVRLQHIADEAFVSVGNLAYHFENKQAILKVLYYEIAHFQRNLLSELNIVPLFEHLDRHWDNLLTVQNAYSFFFIDALEIHRSSAVIAEAHQKHIEWEVHQLAQMVQFNISRGAFVKLEENKAEQLAELLWHFENTWQQIASLRSRESEYQLLIKGKLWLILKTYFTEIGHLEYEQLLKINQDTWDIEEETRLYRSSMLRKSS